MGFEVSLVGVAHGAISDAAAYISPVSWLSLLQAVFFALLWLVLSVVSCSLEEGSW